MGKRKTIEKVLEKHSFRNAHPEAVTGKVIYECACGWAGYNRNKHRAKKITKALKKLREKRHEKFLRSNPLRPVMQWLP